MVPRTRNFVITSPRPGHNYIGRASQMPPKSYQPMTSPSSTRDQYPRKDASVMFGLIHALPIADRRCLDRKEAASYVGVSVGTFDRLVRGGQMPSSIDLFGRKVWDRRALDSAVDAKMVGSVFSRSTADVAPTLSPLDAWRLANG